MTNTPRIVDDLPASQSQWEDACGACACATYFHTPEWAEFFSTYTRGRLKPVPRRIIFEDGLSAIVPLCRIDHAPGLFSTYVSSPAGTFGGWISKDPQTSPHTMTLVRYMLRFRNITWRENPYDPFLGTVPIPGASDDFTQTIDLQEDLEKSHDAANRAHYKALNKAVRSGVTIREAEALSDWQDHFKAYQSSLVRWKKAGTGKKLVKPYAWDLFETIFEKKTPRRRLWCAEYKGSVVASVLCFYWNRHAVAWHGAALEEFFDVRPNNLLYQHMIDHARKNGFRWFDCNTPGGLAGVAEFKDHLGTRRMSSRLVDKASVLRKAVRCIKKNL